MKNILKESVYAINKAVRLLNENKLVSLKTETVYGIACNPSNLNAVKKLYELKKRPVFNPLIIHIDSLEMASNFVVLNKDAKKIASKFWPGPLTLILPKKNSF